MGCGSLRPGGLFTTEAETSNSWRWHLHSRGVHPPPHPQRGEWRPRREGSGERSAGPGKADPLSPRGFSTRGLAAPHPREGGSLARRPPPKHRGCCRGGQAPEPREGGHLRPRRLHPSSEEPIPTRRGAGTSHPHTPRGPDADAARGRGRGRSPGRRRGAWRRERGRGSRAPPGRRRAPGPRGGGGAAPGAAISRQAAGSQEREAAGKAANGAGGGGEGVRPSRA